MADGEALPVAVATEKAYSIVTTTRGKYFGLVSENGGRGITIDSAFEITGDTDAQKVAKGYLRGKLCGDNRRIELAAGLVESVTEALDETRLLRSYEALLPDAERRALGTMTFKALEDLLSK